MLLLPPEVPTDADDDDVEDSVYCRQPRGIPYIAHMNDDLTFTIVAGGREQVEAYLREKEKRP